MAASQAQLESLARSRAIKAQKRELELASGCKVDSETPQRLEKPFVTTPPMEDRTVWVQALCAALISMEIRHATSVYTALPVADAVLKEYKAKFL